MADTIYQDDKTEGRRGPKNKHYPVPHLPRRRAVDYRGTDNSSRLTQNQKTLKINRQASADNYLAGSNEIHNQPPQYLPHVNNPQQIPIQTYSENERSTQNRLGEKPEAVNERTRTTQARQGERSKVVLPPVPSNPSSYPYPTISNERILRESAEALAQKVTFRPNDPRGPRYDDRYWRVGEEVEDIFNRTGSKTFLILRFATPTGEKLKPSFAIRRIFEHPGLWNFDCGEFSQVILLNTLRRMIGDEKFDALPREENDAFRIRRQWSTFLRGSSIKLAWDMKEGKFTRFQGGYQENETKSPEEILRDAPIGSLVNFRNFDPKVASTELKYNPFETENTVTIGPDQYIAFGFGDKKPYYTSKQIIGALAKDGNRGKKIPKDYIEKYIRISGIIPFALPQ